MNKFKFLFLSLCLISISGCSKQTQEVNTTTPPTTNDLKVNACDLTGIRQPNAKVDIGYDSNTINREYYAYTNTTSQLVEVRADKIIAQTKDEEQYKGRYCKDEAKVKGTELSDYDEGHVIADSLGGVSNAYNITPENSYLNRKGSQYQMEQEWLEILRNGGSITNVKVIIEYPDTTSTIPSNYKFSWTQNDSNRSLEFANKC